MQAEKNKERELKRYKKACYNMKLIINDLRKKLVNEMRMNELLDNKIIESLEAEKKKLNDVIMQYENQNLELMKENQEQEKEIKRLKKLNDTLLDENSYLQDNGKRYRLENERMKRRLKEKGIDWS